MQSRFAKFAAIGVFNTLFNLVLFNIFVFGFGFKIVIGNILATLISIAISFFLNAKLVFTDYDFDEPHKTFIKFLLFTLFTQLVVQQLALVFFLDVLTFPGHLVYTAGHAIGPLSGLSKRFFQANTAKLLAVGISLVINFIGYEKLVFASKPKEP